MNKSEDFEIYEDEDGRKILSAYLGHDKKVVVPDGIVAMEDEGDGFIDNSEVEEIVFPDGFEYIPSYAVSGCKNLRSVVLPPSIREINNGAFNDCVNLESVNFPDGLEIIATQAFDSCVKLNADTVSLPPSLLELAFDSFADTLSILRKNPVFVEKNGVVLNTATNFVLCPTSDIGEENHLALASIPAEAEGLAWNSYSFGTFSKIEIPNGVSYIGRGAFMFCKNLCRVELSPSVEVLDSGAFINCDNLEEVVFCGGDGDVEPVEIGSMAFAGCFKLRKVVVPSGSTVADDAFESDVEVVFGSRMS